MRFDLEGNLKFRDRVFDDRRESEETFENGVRVQLVERDNPLGRAPRQCDFSAEGCLDDPDLNLLSWSSRVTDFDAAGYVVQRVTFYDDSDRKALIFSDGMVSERQHYDGDDDETWLVRRTIHGPDGGVLEVIDYDEGDVLPDDLIVLPDTAPSADDFL